jgi:hypothetical protein
MIIREFLAPFPYLTIDGAISGRVRYSFRSSYLVPADTTV